MRVVVWQHRQMKVSWLSMKVFAEAHQIDNWRSNDKQISVIVVAMSLSECVFVAVDSMWCAGIELAAVAEEEEEEERLRVGVGQ